MSDDLDEGVQDYQHSLSASDRLRMLLFLVQKKLEQRRRLQLNVCGVLLALILLSLVLLVTSVAALQYGRLLGGQGKAGARSVLMVKGWGWVLPLLLAPLVMSFLQYLWITFAQLFYRSLNVVDDLLATTDFEEFRPLMHRELLEDDGSLLSQLRNLLVVDFGLTSTLFRIGSVACALLPVLAQGLVSIATTVLLWRDNVGVAIGVAMFYALALALAMLKTWSLYRFVRRMQ